MEKLDIAEKARNGEKIKAIKLNEHSYYIGDTKRLTKDDGRLVRDGVGVQLNLMKDPLTEEIVLDSKYEGEWKDGEMHGKGCLQMGNDEKYEGEFFEGEANGQGYYCFQNGDFYSGEFFDGKMNGEGCYFLRNGDCSEGIFMNSKFMYDGIPIEPYLPEKEKKALIRKLTLGQKKDDKINELKDIQVIKDADSLVSFINQAITMRRVVLLLRLIEFEGNFGNIVQTFLKKKAKFQICSVPEPGEEDKIFELLCVLRQAMTLGELVLLNLEGEKENPEFLGGYDITDVLPIKFLNRDSMTIIQKMRSFGIDEPEFIHPNFMVVMCGSKRVRIDDQKEHKRRILSRYPWVERIGRLEIAALKSLKKVETIYETALFEESYNFANQLEDY